MAALMPMLFLENMLGVSPSLMRSLFFVPDHGGNTDMLYMLLGHGLANILGRVGCEFSVIGRVMGMIGP